MFCILTALVKDKANTDLQDAFLDEIMKAGGPMEQALNYLNVEKLLPVQKV